MSSVYLLLALVATKPNSFARWIYHLAALQKSSCIQLMFSLCDPPLQIIWIQCMSVGCGIYMVAKHNFPLYFMSATTRRYPHFFKCLFQDDSNCCWTCGVLIGYLQPHSDKYDKWQADSTCWPLCFSMGASVVPCNSTTCEQVIVHLSCNRFLRYQKELNPWLCFVGYSPIFPDWSPISDLQRAIASKAAETVANWWRHCIWYAMHWGTGTQTHHIRIADKKCAMWYIVLDLM